MSAMDTIFPLPLLFLVPGLLVGSFLNVLVFRLETGEDFVGGRSRCRSCGAVIRWYDNIPLLSFLLLRGRCRVCRERISLQYPLVELSTGVAFLLSGTFLFRVGDIGSVFETTLALGLIPALIVVFVYDLRNMEIPVSVLAFGILWALFSLFFLWLFATPPVPFSESRLFSGLIGSGVAFVLFYGLVFFSKEAWMGEGDAWLALLLGLVSGWQLLLPALTVAFGLGALVGTALLASGKKHLQSRIPFGPFLSVSVIFLLIFGTLPVWDIFLLSWVW